MNRKGRASYLHSKFYVPEIKQFIKLEKGTNDERDKDLVKTPDLGFSLFLAIFLVGNMSSV